MIPRMQRPLLVACLCTGALTLAGCGHSGDKRSAAPLWAQRANAVCNINDDKIKTAETLAVGVIFSANTAAHMIAELNGLKNVGFVEHSPQSFVDTGQALEILRTKGDSASVRRADSLLLTARKDAAAKGVHCSFGAVPLREVG